MEWQTPGGEEGRVMRVVYRYGEYIKGDGESIVKKQNDSDLTKEPSCHGYVDDAKSLAEEGLALVARKVLESRKEGLKLNESAAVVNNLVKRIRRTIEARCETLKKEIDTSAEEAYVSLNNVLNDFCEEGKRFKGSLESFNMVMKRCKNFIERFKQGELLAESVPTTPVEGEGEEKKACYAEHLMQILATLVKTHTPSFDFNISLSYEPNNTSLGPYPLGRLMFDCKNPNEQEGKSKDNEEAKREEITAAKICSELSHPETISFKLIKDLTYWRSVECVSEEMRPLGLVTLLMITLPQNLSSETLQSEPSDEIPPTASRPTSPSQALKPSKSGTPITPRASNSFKSHADTPLSNAADVRSSSLQRSYLLLSSSSEMEIFNEGLNQLVRCVKVHSIKEPIDIVSWKEWVAISNNKNDLIHVVSMFSKTVSKYPIPGGCGNLSVDSEGKITITCRHGNNIILFDALNNKLAKIKLHPTITKATHAVRFKYRPSTAAGDTETPEEEEVFLVSQADKLHRVCVLNNAGEIINSYGDKRGSGQGQLNKPEYMLADNTGHFIICDSGNCRLLVLDSSLTLVKEISLRPLEVGRPTKVSLDHNNRLIFITDPLNKSIVVTHYSMQAT